MISSFHEKRDLLRTQLPSKRLRGSLSQEIQSANHQDNHRRWRQDQLCDPLRTCKSGIFKLSFTLNCLYSSSSTHEMSKVESPSTSSTHYSIYENNIFFGIYSDSFTFPKFYIFTKINILKYLLLIS